MAIGVEEQPQRHGGEDDDDSSELLISRNSNSNSSVSHHNDEDMPTTTTSPPALMTATTSTTTTSTSTATSTHSVERASYPLRPTLSKLLQQNATNDKKSAGSSGGGLKTKESPTQALTNVLENSIEALDRWYFSVNAKTRKTLSHRTCLRIAASTTTTTTTSNNNNNNSVTITDLGIGMTRADMINLLGVGTSSSSSSSSGSSSSSRSCLTKDVGGFYAAVCAVAVGVKVGTKSKFDDYYEFQVGHTPTHNSWKEFVITRPMDEGTIPCVANGQRDLTDVRGESGTSVTLYLQDKHKAMLSDPKQLLRMITKILETTQYTFLVDGICTKEEKEELIMASEDNETKLSKRKDSVDNVVVDEGDDNDDDDDTTTMNTNQEEFLNSQNKKRQVVAVDHSSVKERAKYIPLRLSLGERKLLRLSVAAMNCCDYTTQVDKPLSGKNQNVALMRRTHAQLKGVMSVLRGLVTACDYAAGQKLCQQQQQQQQHNPKNDSSSSSYEEYQGFLRRVLEIARRHKIMNPEKMRTEYGKLIYMLQDAVRLQEDEHLDGVLTQSLIAPIQTVYRFLNDRHGVALLEDKLIEIATEEILATKGKSRSKIDAEIRRKERAVAHLKRQYQSQHLSAEDIHLCLYSICDNNSFLNSNRVPVDTVIAALEKHFSPKVVNSRYSLSIVKGQEGARLSHSHERQYYFALQSLTLWREIINDMFRLWAMGETDLLSESIPYNLQDTGQGMQRVQQSPLTYKAMQEILVRVQTKVQQWVGSSVIHLGDHNVPNALSFIDKYTQVPRILGPIVRCLENLEKLCEEDYGIQDMVDEGFGGLDKLRKDILYDFFRSAFDGSGADNFYDAGSCIDGRLTSAWNWCSQLPNKPFYPIFKLTGFTGFDGEFK